MTLIFPAHAMIIILQIIFSVKLVEKTQKSTDYNERSDNSHIFKHAVVNDRHNSTYDNLEIMWV